MEFLKSFALIAGVILVVALLASWQAQFSAIRIIGGLIVVAFNAAIIVAIFRSRE